RRGGAGGAAAVGADRGGFVRARDRARDCGAAHRGARAGRRARHHRVPLGGWRQRYGDGRRAAGREIEMNRGGDHNRLVRQFAALARENRAALILYLTAGDPSLAETPGLILEAARAGADVIELGVPWSDPSADGP